MGLPYQWPNLESGSWDPEQIRRNFEWLASRLTVSGGRLVPSGAIVMMRSGSTCPPGYTQVTDATLAERYLRVSLTTAGATGGFSTISVDPTNTTMTLQITPGGSDVTFAISTHTHIVALTPKFFDIILCEKN